MTGIRERLSLKALLFGLGGFGALALLVVAVTMGLRTYDVSSTADRVVAVYEPAAEEVASLTLANSDMERGVILYVLGGRESDLMPYLKGERRSEISLDGLNRLLGGDPQIKPLVEAVETSRIAYVETVAKPAIQLMRSGRATAARELATGSRSERRFERLVDDTATLRNEVTQVQRVAFRQLADLIGGLARALGASAVALLLALLGAGILMFRWVLGPLNDLRHEIRDVARTGNHGSPINPTGPVELSAVGRDAEAMRRQLVSEIDEARSAREALEQRAPLVAAIRRELSMATDPTIPGLRVHGEVHAAEGVLAGDWWDCVRLPNGGAALIITDVSGHGPAAGVAAMRLKHMLALIMASGLGPADALSMAARTFADDPGRFATVAIVCVDPETGVIRWANGGHPPPVLRRAEGTVSELTPTGPLLSWLGGPWATRETRMDASDLLLVYSDGLVESHDRTGVELDVSGLLTLVDHTRDADADPSELVERVLAGARRRAVDWDRDDVTLVALRLASRPRPGSVLPEPRRRRSTNR